VEPEANEEALSRQFRVIWHKKAQEDIRSVDPSWTDRIIRSADKKLQIAPHLIGEPLKGTTSRLWKIRAGKYRILYTICKEEVVILAVGNRDFIYNKHNASVQELIRTAAALHQHLKRGSF